MKKVLVVDDAAVERTRAGGLLKKEYEVQYAKQGIEALELIETDLPDVVLTDLVMPEMDGLELVRALKESYPLIPVILMTSQGNESIAIEALNSGAASYLPKRLLGEELRDTVYSVLSVRNEKESSARLQSCITRTRYRFILENDIELIAPLINMLQESLIDKLDIDDTERIRMAIALEEALSNAIYHGNLELDSALREGPDDGQEYFQLAAVRKNVEPFLKRRVHVEASRTDQEFRIVIRDDGPGYDPDSLPDPTDPENLEKVHGRGLLLIRTFMDAVEHNDAGNELTMIKRFPTMPLQEASIAHE